MAHAWTADRLGDPTARLLGRVSLNPIVHADPIGTVLFPLIAMVSGVPLIGWAKPVPVNIRRLRHPRRDYMLVAAAGPASNLVLAFVAAIAAGGAADLAGARWASRTSRCRSPTLLSHADPAERAARGVQHDADSAARRRQRARRAAAATARGRFDQIRPVRLPAALRARCLTGGFDDRSCSPP